MSVDDTSEIIRQVLAEFALSNSVVELLDSTDHCNARIVTASGSYFLKVLAAGSAEAGLLSRLHFADFLREGGLPIPMPLQTTSGRRFAITIFAGQQRLGVLYPWIEGETLGDCTDAHWIEQSGELLARLHIRAQSFDPADDFEVQAWDKVYAPEEDGWLRTFLLDAPLDDAARKIIEQAAARTRFLDSQVPRDRCNYWLIHSDFHGDNQIFDGERIWIVDLDDVGWGHLLFDVAWSALLFAKHHPDCGESLDPLLRGYERIRPLAVTERELLPEFQLAAGIGALEMVHTSPIENNDPIAIAWFDFMVKRLRTSLV
jgi:Ser/Thr protein kinase RdoA (MazF antagonist)